MNTTMFKLISTYELFVTINTIGRPMRMEIYKSLDSNSLFRARVWIQNTYNLYPALVNTDENGEDLHRIHSSDQLDLEITTHIAEESEFITGKYYASESDFLDHVLLMVNNYNMIFEQDASE